MATEIKLPGDFEEVQDITINRWLVKAGQEIKKGDPILEVATEKVDTQIESPADGTVLQLNVSEGELVAPDAVLGLIGAPDEAGQQAPARAPEQPAETETKEAEARPVAAAEPAEAETKEAEAPEAPEAAEAAEAPQEQPRATPVARRVAQEEGIPLTQVRGSGKDGEVTKEDVLSYLNQAKEGKERREEVEAPAEGFEDEELADVASLPVRRLAVEYDLDLREVAQGRPLSALTKYDVLSFVRSREAGKPVQVEPRPRPEWAQPQQPAREQPQPPAERQQAIQAPPKPAEDKAGPKAEVEAGEELVPHTRMRSLVARNTVQSAFGIPHVTTWWDVNMTGVVEHRNANKAEFTAAGVNLTYTAYFIMAAVAGLKTVPAANSSWTDEGVIIRHYYNIGMAVALPADEHGMGGLIVPVIHNAGDLNLMGVARAVNDLAARARQGKLRNEDMQGGTFSVTNYGTSGSRFQTPIIAGNQAGILGIGVMEKRPAVVSRGHPLEANIGDYLAFLPMVTLGFSYDHRILDGATADAFCAAVKETLENWK